jgi:hypothetical protein
MDPDIVTFLDTYKIIKTISARTFAAKRKLTEKCMNTGKKPRFKGSREA